ncbi:related to LSB6-LAs17 Binding protein [Serendipita indica DSM 11827]|uniref:Phosphatidylinositol 4-kinase n=1 Tax=Serendipita indica (strain DSM 11827) TaxID=1109443 RepID=G4T8E7_SERID|nr:related to LSB6-LAs17 Binding protein [Serendipita indica DSM 11827]
MPSQAGYQRLAQDDDAAPTVPHTRSSTSSSFTRQRRLSRPEIPKIDLHDIQDKFKAWLERVKSRKALDIHKQEIAFSVFEPAFSRSVYPTAPLKTLDHGPPMSKETFDKMIDAVKESILDGVHPKLIAKGSSGSYFVRVKDGDRHKTVGVFKPQNEEPYGNLNPKTTKWLHRKLSYISEAAASLMDTRLQLNIVPRTELVSLSSSSFFYDWIDRVAAKKGKPLPEKIGSFQTFLHGYTDATVFLREHPWPGRSISDTFDDSNHRSGAATKRLMSALSLVCGKTGEEEDLTDEEVEDEQARTMYEMPESTDFYWSLALQQDFRLELEKLVILDYIIRNTDRGSDNYMIKYCNQSHERSIVDQAPSRTTTPVYTSQDPMKAEPTLRTTPLLIPSQEPPPATSTTEPNYSRPHMHIAAIDNSLSFPHEHPKGWRSFTYGWLYLPVSLIGRPFSEQTRRHFLPLLSSKAWWEETTYQLKKLFAIDPGFHPKMFARQMAVIKGQAWNVLQSLKHPDEGPLELTRRVNVLVWDDELEVGETFSADALAGPLSAGPLPNGSSPFARGSPTRIRRIRSVSSPRIDGNFPPMSRSSSDFTGATRPVPFSSKVTRVNPSATGVSVLEHMERLDKVEEGLTRLGPAEDTLYEDEEAEEAQTDQAPLLPAEEIVQAVSAAPPAAERQPEPSASRVSTKPTLSGLGTAARTSIRMSEEAQRPSHIRWASHGNERSGRSMDVSRRPVLDAESGKKVVIAERVETVDAKPFFSCW